MRKAYGEIKLKGCVLQNAKLVACSMKWCGGDDATSRNFSDGEKESSTSADDGGACGGRCRDRVDMLHDCEDRILKKWFRKYGVKEEYHR